ncbi:hypothetical protein MPL3356_60495 [Mesorhizobium plurifarium]|uniref:Prohead serine protease domain-containing protein n=1 Tax=Mesorhizobium plurifarium TaxID=69974 RepID=A0A090G6P9_MESPL|nr:hypothetical protein MPL3356_60495 [Mesorhizobium plurifarium]
MAKFKRASADEVHAKRKEHVRDGARGPVMVKGFKSPPSWNKEARSARFIMTSESVDRYRDIVVQAGGDFTHFLENPQGLLFHNSRSWPCGLWSDVTKILNGRPKRTEGTLNFLAEGVDEDADRAARHVAAGTLRTVSIGFAPNWDDIDFILDDDDDWTGGFRYNTWELLECSVVPIPAQPDALVKDAGGDLKLARELIEEVLDTWAKTPEGLLIPMEEYRAKHFDLGVNRSTFIVDKALVPAPRKFVPVAEMEIKAATNDDAEKFVGAKVTLKPDHPENKGSPFSDCLAKATGEVIASWIVSDGEFKGVHALAVEFLTDGWNGLFRGIKADRFLLAEKADKEVKDDDDDPDDQDDPEIDPDEEGKSEEAKGLLTDEVLDAFATLVEDGDIVVLRDGDDMALVIERAGERVEELKLPLEMTIKQIGETSQSICDRVNKIKEAAQPKPPVSVASMSIEVDTKDATEKVTALEAIVDRLSAKLAKIFGRAAEPEPPAPTPEPPSEEDVTAAKAAAAAARARVAEKGLLAA